MTSSVTSGWHCIYGSDYHAASLPKPTKKALGKGRRRENIRPTPGRAAAGSQRTDTRSEDSYAYTITDEYQGSNYCTSSDEDDGQQEDPNEQMHWVTDDDGDSGYDIDAITIRRVRMDADDREDITHTVADVIDRSRYAVTVGSLSAVVTVWWLNSEQGKHWAKFIYPKRQVEKNPRSQKLYATNSSSLSIRNSMYANKWLVWVVF